MDDFEEEVQYFIELVNKNIQLLKTNKPINMSKEEMIFFNVNIRIDRQEIVVYNQEKDLVYDIFVKDIQNFKFKNINKSYVLNTISILAKYLNKEMSFIEFMKIFKQEYSIV